MSRGKNRRSAAPPPTKPPTVVCGQRKWLGWTIVVALLLVIGGVVMAMMNRRGAPPAPPAAEPIAATSQPSAQSAAPATTPTTSPAAAVTADAFAAYAGSESCRECHPGAYDGWKGSHHALAERAVLPALDQSAFVPTKKFSGGGETATFSAATTQPAAYQIEITDSDGTKRAAAPERVIGHDPLRQFLLSADGGRAQAVQVAFDPHKKEWFDVFGNDARKPGEWGHWTGRGMNWNSMCAACHNTRLQKNYDAERDIYDTRMAEVAIGCESCHGPMKAHVEWQHKWHASTQPSRYAAGAAAASAPTTQNSTRPSDPTIKPVSRDLAFDTCGSCHARRGELTSDFLANTPFTDHYRLQVVDESDAYYADGQVREEDYEYAAFLGSRMHAAGVRCVDCHNAHSGKPVLQGDFLCMRCHQGIETYPTAPKIDPKTHTFHKAESTGSRCVNCHMPQTTYMQRHVRHDHGFTVPDPLLTKQHNIPNACNRCHADKSADWSLSFVEKWYGAKMQRPSRARTQAIAAAKTGDAAARQPLIDLLADQKETPYWKAVATGLLTRWVGEPAAASAVVAQMAHASPLVRSEAARAAEPLLEFRPDARGLLEKLLDDPSRAVRVAAAWSLRQQLDLDSTAGRDLRRMMAVNADQPLGPLQLAHFAAARAQPSEALKHAATAVAWDPASAAMRQEYAVMLSGAGQIDEAIRQLQEACELAPNDAEYAYLLALAYNERSEMPRTIEWLRKAVSLDPKHARAWYNLGLALNSSGDATGALSALHSAEAASPNDPRIPYARATILARTGKRDDAIAAATRAVELRPDFEQARQLVEQLRAAGR
jgi:tetratricopeptide (TPR) repeat protein